MKKILLPLFITGMIASCNLVGNKTSNSKAPLDSLMYKWNKGWNDHDSASVRNMFTADALLIDDNLIAVNATGIADKWISPNINVVSNFKATELQSWSTTERAGYTGKYVFEVIIKDSVIAKPAGAFTINWVKVDNGDWKITSATIHSFVEKK